MSGITNTDNSRLSADKENDSLLRDYENYSHRDQRISSYRKWILTCFNAALALVVGTSIFCNIILFIEQFKGRDLDKVCNEHTTEYPLLFNDDFSLKYQTVKFNGSFFGDSIYRQFVGPEADQAWLDLGVHFRSIAIPEDKAEKYGIAKGQVKRIKKQGGGYLVNMEVFHHLHCLDMLRKVSHYSYEYYQPRRQGEFANTEDIVKLHAEHCLDMLRQHIMCTADVGVFGQWFVKGLGPFVDFNTKHKCKDFNQIRDWAEKAQVEEGLIDVEERPGDVVLTILP